LQQHGQLAAHGCRFAGLQQQQGAAAPALYWTVTRPVGRPHQQLLGSTAVCAAASTPTRHVHSTDRQQHAHLFLLLMCAMLCGPALYWAWTRPAHV
jgi:hypothetical protein